MKRKIYLVVVVMLLCFTALKSNAAVVVTSGDAPLTKEAVAKMSPAEKKDRRALIKARIKEIKKIDKSQMSDEDRKALKEELRALRHESGALGDDIVLSTAGAIVVVLGLLLTGAV